MLSVHLTNFCGVKEDVNVNELNFRRGSYYIGIVLKCQLVIYLPVSIRFFVKKKNIQKNSGYLKTMES